MNKADRKEITRYVIGSRWSPNASLLLEGFRGSPPSRPVLCKFDVIVTRSKKPMPMPKHTFERLG